ncbi:MAG TPA: DUF3025 domain-containing protein [Methyloversatilis sp.]
MHDGYGLLHVGLRHLLIALGTDKPEPAAIDALAAASGRPKTCGGRAIFFSSPPVDGLGYEARIATTGCVATRDGSRHDLFNALVWLTFPLVKAAMNRRHCDEAGRIVQSIAGRGPVRDALTQFDEDGLLLVSDDAALLDALREHRWREAMWERRGSLESARLFVLGHALMDKALVPHFGLCAKACYLHGEQLGQSAADLTPALVDAWLAARITDGIWPRSPLDLHPLPVLGLPGMTPDSESAAYFDDVRQFRPLPAHRRQK